MEAREGLKVLASPARQNRERNPFNYLLSEALAHQGCEVIDLDGRNGWTDPADVLHIHWPQQLAQGPLRRALMRSMALAGIILVQRLRGARIVWTVHNVRGHDQNHPLLERALMWFVVKQVHGVIFLTASSRPAACAEMPALAEKPFAIILHGLYRQVSDKTGEEARAAFGLPSNARVIGFLGDIKRYKGLDRLLDFFEKASPEGVTLFTAGGFSGRRYRAEVHDRISALIRDGRSIVFREERLDDASLVDAIRACDAIALPYHEAWNSGLALLVIENGGRILASDAPVFRELREEVGPEQVHLFDGELTDEIMAAALEEAAGSNAGRAASFRAARSWPVIGAQTVAFYRQLGAAVGREMRTL